MGLLYLYLCEWESHVNSLHYSKKNWPLHTSHTPGTKNVALQHIVDKCKVLLPPLHIKLGLGKNFKQALDKNGPAISFLCEKFPELSMEKIKAVAVIGLQIQSLILLLVMVRRQPAMPFNRMGLGGFFFFKGSVRAVNFRKLMEDLVTSYEKFILCCHVRQLLLESEDK